MSTPTITDEPVAEELPEVWSAEELAKRTGVGKSTICRWADAGLLPVVRKFPGQTGVWVFRKEALRAVQDRQEAAPTW